VKTPIDISERIVLIDMLWNSWKGGKTVEWYQGKIEGTEKDSIKKCSSICLKEGFIVENEEFPNKSGFEYLITEKGIDILKRIFKKGCETIDWEWERIEEFNI